MLRVIALAVLLVGCEARAGARERLVGGPCEGCEAVFEGRPAKLSAHARIAPATEPGEPMVLHGIVTTAAGKPAANVIVYAYHTDARGEYPPVKGAKHRHGRLRGFAKTGADGRYTFTTIRPASYPNTSAPQHVHMHVIEPGRCHYYIDDVMFTDDPKLSEDEKAHRQQRGGNGIVTPTRGDDNVWRVRRDIVLGAAIADYDRCGS